MGARFTPYNIQGSELDFSAASGRIISTGTVSEIPSNTPSDAAVLLACLTADGMPKLGKDTYPGTSLVFNRLFARGYSNDGLMVALYYETFQGIIPSAYIIRDHSSMTSRTMTFDPISGKLLEVSYDGSAAIVAAGGSLGDFQEIPALDRILCPTEVLMPCREVSVTRVAVGHPKSPKVFGGVNDTDWPGSPGSPQLPNDESGNPQGIDLINSLWTSPADVGDPLPKGYWLFHKKDSDWTRFQNYFTIELAAISMVNFPWSQLLVARDPSTGLYVKPRPDVLQTAIQDAMTDYKQGLKQYNNDGFGIYGPYPPIDFKAAIFGF